MRFLYWFAGAEGEHYLDSHPTSPNGEIHKFQAHKFDRQDTAWELHSGQKYSGSARLGVVPPNYRQTPSISSSITALVGSVRSGSMQQDDCLKWFQHRNPRENNCDRTGLKGPIQNQMTYHNMFTPSQEPGTLWRCRSCGKEVTNRWHHFHSHTAQRSMCPYCPATYSRIDTLRSHLKQKHKNQA
jgi:DNA-directed RNA polymerase subunit RPC12/RpoP